MYTYIIVKKTSAFLCTYRQTTKLGCSKSKSNSPNKGCCAVMNKLIPSSTPTKMESFTGRKKVLLAPGHSLMDWIRLGRAEGDLSGVGNNKIQVTPSELAMHNTQKDIWMCIRGR